VGEKPDQADDVGQSRAPIGIIKQVFGFAKVRTAGSKNAHRLIVGCGSLFCSAQRHPLRCDVA
jgi:hypothetical protein